MKSNTVYMIGFLIILQSCITNTNNATNQTIVNSNIEKELLQIGYKNLFLLGEDSKVDDIWDNGKMLKALENIVSSENSTPYGRFLAAEALLRFKVAIKKKYYPIVAEAYANTLSLSSTQSNTYNFINGNSWGLLYEQDDLGYLGKQFLLFDKASIPHLTSLLEDNNAGILFEGSEEAMIGSSYQYRIKDFAAFYLHKITAIPIKFHQEIKQRDAEIERFKKQLQKIQYD